MPCSKDRTVIVSKSFSTKALTLSISLASHHVRQIYDTLSALPHRPTLFTTHGDHNFVSPSTELAPQGFKYQDQITELVTSQILIGFQGL